MDFMWTSLRRFVLNGFLLCRSRPSDANRPSLTAATLPFNFVRLDVHLIESKPCFEALSDCHEMEISSQKLWDLSVYLKQMFLRVRMRRCTAGNYDPKLSGFTCVHLLPGTKSFCCQAREREAFFDLHLMHSQNINFHHSVENNETWQAAHFICDLLFLVKHNCIFVSVCVSFALDDQQHIVRK